jgi:hypothetical protein
MKDYRIQIGSSFPSPLGPFRLPKTAKCARIKPEKEKQGTKGIMKHLFIALLAASVFVGCDQQKATIEDNKDATQKAMDEQKKAVDDAAKEAKRQVEANKDATQAQIEAEKKKVEAQAEADKAKVDAAKQ